MDRSTEGIEQDDSESQKETRLPRWLHNFISKCSGSLNFYRVHVIYFSITPLIVAAIMWGTSNHGYDIPYIDCLFVCMSAMTVTGLSTINLSTLNSFQQALLFILMLVGNPPVISLITIVVRRHFFRSAFRHAIQERQRRARRRPSFSMSRTFTRATSYGPISAIRKRFSTNMKEGVEKEETPSTPDGHDGVDGGHEASPSEMEMKSVNRPKSPRPDASKSKFRMGKKKVQNISKGMIKRVEGGGVGLVNPMGWYDAQRQDEPSPSPGQPSEETTRVNDSNDEAILDEEEEDRGRPAVGRHLTSSPDHMQGDEEAAVVAPSEDKGKDGVQPRAERINRPSIPTIVTDQYSEEDLSAAPFDGSMDLSRDSGNIKVPYAGRSLNDDAFPRSRTIAFDDTDDGFDHDHRSAYASAREGSTFPRTATYRSQNEGRVPMTATTTMPRTYSLRPSITHQKDTRLSGFGGFPTPFELIHSAVQHVFPKTTQGLTKTLSMPRTATIGGRGTIGPEDNDTKEVPYISFSAVVGRNSHFKGLTEEQMNELGGVEYRALKILLWIVVGYIIFWQLAAFVIIAPSIAAHGTYDHVFEAQPRLVGIPWFSLWQSISAFTNTGMSLVDKSMVPFQRAYAMVITLLCLILAGNTAFPVLLRITVWCIYKIVPRQSRVKETLKFLLDHPRRCYIYLFPTTQTWVLAFVVLSLTLTDWVSFLVLDIGTPAIEALPVGTRIADAFLQSVAVRAAGFGIVPLSELAPAVQVLYVIMMYISVYPIALSVRATNVYEERSLGLYNEEEEEEDLSPTEEAANGGKAQAVAKYLGWHARRQLAFDIWWLGFALWLICIIERPALGDASSDSYLNVFTIIFELVSGYGTVGLSLGAPNNDYSLCGSFRKLSKLVLIFVMLRGRHRGLPVAIDRAVMLPRDFTVAEEQAIDDRLRRVSRRGSIDPADMYMRRGSMSNMSTSVGGGEASAIPPHMQSFSQAGTGSGTSLPGTPGRRRERSISPTRKPSLSAVSTTSAGPSSYPMQVPGQGQGHGQGQGQSHRRTGSSSSYARAGPPPALSLANAGLQAQGYGSGPGTPTGTALQFALPRGSAERQRSNTLTANMTPNRSGAGGGVLSPVEESALSRVNTAN